MPSYTSVSDYLLDVAHHDTPYASGGNGTRVYLLPELSLPNMEEGEFLLRIEPDSGLSPVRIIDAETKFQAFREMINATSALVPMALMNPKHRRPLEINVGQVRLEGEGFQVVSLVKGRNLESILGERRQYYLDNFHRETEYSRYVEADFKAHRDIYNILNNIPLASYVKLMESINELTKRGLAIDANWENFLIHGDEIRIIDVADPKHPRKVSENNLQTLLSVLTAQPLYPNPPSDLAVFCAKDLEPLRAKLIEAAELAHFPRDMHAAEKMLKQSKIKSKGGLYPAEDKSIPLSASMEEARALLGKVMQYHTPEEEHSCRHIPLLSRFLHPKRSSDKTPSTPL